MSEAQNNEAQATHTESDVPMNPSERIEDLEARLHVVSEDLHQSRERQVDLLKKLRKSNEAARLLHQTMSSVAAELKKVQGEDDERDSVDECIELIEGIIGKQATPSPSS